MIGTEKMGEENPADRVDPSDTKSEPWFVEVNPRTYGDVVAVSMLPCLVALLLFGVPSPDRAFLYSTVQYISYIDEGWVSLK